MAASVPELVTLVPGDEPNTFKTANLPERMGNAADIAYGGCALAFAFNAACSTVPTDTHKLYSATGYYLSGATVDRIFHARVTPIRDTRSFCTRSVLVWQVLDNGSSRSVLTATLDFHRTEPASLLTYSVPPHPLAGALDDSWDADRSAVEIRKLPGASEPVVAAFKAAFAPFIRLFEQREISASVGRQNLRGMLKHLPTTQDHLPITDKVSLDWTRPRVPSTSHAEHVCTMAFHMDAAVAFVPLTHNHMFLFDAAACSSLDFAMRFFQGAELDFNDWHLREIKTVAGSEGRTYSHARVWDRRGRLVAEMSQQSILRPKKPKGAAKM